MAEVDITEKKATWSFYHSFINNMKFNIVLQKLRNQRMIVGVSIYYELKDNLKTLNYTISNAVSICFYYCSIHFPMHREEGVGKPRIRQLTTGKSNNYRS